MESPNWLVRVALSPTAVGAGFGVWEGQLGGDESVQVRVYLGLFVGVQVGVCLGLYVSGGEWDAPRKSMWSV